ncbi:MAG: alpha/beta hydrolase, partial [Duncaniella sp.]|nr:alpha/beta hydrolase [Duncaniella sp.]
MLRLSILYTLLCVLALPSLHAEVNPTVPRDTSFTVWSTAVKVRKKHPDAVILRPDLPAGVTAHENVVYTRLHATPFGERDLHVDIYRPDSQQLLPAVIMIHGGGWNSGDKTLQRPMAMQLAARGYVAIPLEYRLIPEALYPAGLHDVKTAVRWVRSHAADYGIDHDRIALWGCSAGSPGHTQDGV